ncbi:MAG: DNA polymerase III, beta subunit [uncultured bacterium]|nr:MAG: DNA polymerase III, beta subunit [uncultured bacterium]
MKLSCNQEKLNKSLNIVNKIIGVRGTLPILNNILLATDKGRLKLASTDLEIGITTWVGAKIEIEGSITLPAKVLTDFVGTNDDEKIDLELKETTLEIKSNKYNAHIKGIESSEFPLIPEIKTDKLLSLPVKLLQEAIRKILFSVATDETRPVLTGVYFVVDKNTLKLATTDSYRLAEATIKLEQSATKSASIIIPSRTMSELGRILSAVNSNVDVYLEENQILFMLGDTQIISRLIEGNFPDYTQIIPKDHSSQFEVVTNELAKVVKMASFFARESANNIKLNFTDNELLVSAVSPQLGDNVSKIPIKSEGENLDIAFNAKFVLDILGIIDEESVIVEANGKLQPTIIKPLKDKKFLYVVMPLRVDE